MTNNQRIVIVGATSLIAEHCARLWAQQGAGDFVLLARDQSKLQSIAADLKVRNPDAGIQCIQGDFLNPDAIKRQVNDIAAQKRPDIVLIAHGTLPDQNQCQQNLTETEQAIRVNAVSPALFAEAFAEHLEKENHGTLAVIGSVAGDRGRKSNYVYGASKGLVTRYVQGLQHRLAATRVKIVLIKPGPTDTPMTAHLKHDGASLAAPEDVAQRIVNGIKSGSAVVYAPAKWWLIMMIIRHLPRMVFNRMDI
jgi:decaprenylphospho-beta-D-erythro-pentofuranosid-2-ulose 2-reductase